MARLKLVCNFFLFFFLLGVGLVFNSVALIGAVVMLIISIKEYSALKRKRTIR
jgi:hypothetical protein